MLDKVTGLGNSEQGPVVSSHSQVLFKPPGNRNGSCKPVVQDFSTRKSFLGTPN